MVKVQGASLRRCLDGRRYTKKSLTFCGTGTCQHQYYTALETKVLGETMLLDLCVSSLREKGS